MKLYNEKLKVVAEQKEKNRECKWEFREETVFLRFLENLKTQLRNQSYCHLNWLVWRRTESGNGRKDVLVHCCFSEAKCFEAKFLENE